MRGLTVDVNNLKRLNLAFSQLKDTGALRPKIGLVYGDAGFGKTVATAWLAGRTNAVFVTATPYWTPGELLRSILNEMGLEPVGRSNQEHFNQIVQRIHGRPLFVDEGDYLFDGRGWKAMVEALRSIHDMADIPVLLIGMDRIAAKTCRLPQFESRIVERVVFEPLALEDARLICSKTLDVTVSDATLRGFLDETGGNARRFCQLLAKHERLQLNAS